MRNRITLLAGIIIALPAAMAAERFDPAARAKTIAPFIDEQTVVVAHVTLADKDGKPRADIDAAHAAFCDIVRTACPDPKEADKVIGGLKEGKVQAERWVADMVKAGGREVYAVLSIADLPEHSEPFTVVPLTEGADERAIAGLLCNGDASGPATRPAEGGASGTWVTERVGGAMFCGASSTLARLKAEKPADRPELAKAFEAAGDTAMQTLLLPTADTRRVLEDMIPTLPTFLGGGPSTQITRGVMWVAAGANTQPQVSARVVIQSENAESALALQKFVDQAFGALKENAEVRTVVTNLDELWKLLRPTVTGDRVELVVDAKTMIPALTRSLTPVFSQARGKARRAVSASNLKQLMLACIMYATDHKNEWPKDLDSLVAAKLIPPQVLVNPACPDRKVGYIYVRPTVPMSKIDPRSAVAYEAYDTWGDGISVAFADGHVQFMKNEMEFRKALSLAQTQPAKP